MDSQTTIDMRKAMAKRTAEQKIEDASKVSRKHIANAKKQLVSSINRPFLLSDAVCKRLSVAFDALSAAERELEAIRWELAEEHAASIAPGLVPDGTEGQDRKSYSDTQDRKSYQ